MLSYTTSCETGHKITQITTNKMSADDLKEIVEDCVFNNTVEKDCLAADYARSFIQEVNFYEIAERVNSEIDLQA